MKTNVLLVLLLSFYGNGIFAQDYLRGNVIDAETGEPIPFVNIGATKLGTGTVSNEKGQYRLRISAPTDVITFSSIGYHTENIEVQQLAESGAVALRPRPYDIPAIELKASALTKDVILGARLEEQGHSIGFGSSELGTEVGAHIAIEKETAIKSAHFPINHAAGDSMLFRVNVYDFQNGKVGDNLLPENVIITAVQQRGEVEVDLSAFNLAVAHDVLLALEWIKGDEGKGNVGVTFRSKKSRRNDNLYSKHTSQAPFRKMSGLFPRAPKLQLGFYLKGRQEK